MTDRKQITNIINIVVPHKIIWSAKQCKHLINFRPINLFWINVEYMPGLVLN